METIIMEPVVQPPTAVEVARSNGQRSAATVQQVEGLPYASLGPAYAQFLDILNEDGAVTQLLNQHGIAVIRGWSDHVHPGLAGTRDACGNNVAAFLAKTAPSIARKKQHVSQTTFRGSGSVLVASARECFSVRCNAGQFLKPPHASLDPDVPWDKILSHINGQPIEYMSDLQYSILASDASRGALSMADFSAGNCVLRAVTARMGLTGLDGMTNNYLYIGRAFSVFAAHAEDYNLASLNELLIGQPKVWYAVPPEYFSRVTEVLRAAARGMVPGCPQALMHKLALPKLALLLKAGIPVSKVVQRHGDLVITAPGGFHWGVNCGPNVAESTNFGDRTWLAAGRYADFLSLGPCTCTEHSKWRVQPRQPLVALVDGKAMGVKGALQADGRALARRFGLEDVVDELPADDGDEA